MSVSMQSATPLSVETSKDETKTPPNTPVSTKLTMDFVESLKPKVRVVDSDENLKLYCYSTCDENDSDEVKFCRGLVFDNDKNLVLKAYSYTPEYTTEEHEKIISLLQPVWSGCTVFDSYEGAIIRVFYFKDKWYISTHRRLDAFKSKWADKLSFGSLFFERLMDEVETSEDFSSFVGSPSENEKFEDRFLSLLNKEYQYFFLVKPSGENRIVSDYPENNFVLHVGTFKGQEEVNESIGLSKPQQHNFDTIEDMLAYVDNVNIGKLQGTVVFTPTTQIKVLNTEYKYYFDIRGNEPSIKFRYLQLRMDRQKRRDLMDLYPTHVPIFDSYEDIIYDIAQNIKNAYVERFIRKQFVRMPQEEYAIMKQCHEWHHENRDQHHINFQRVIDIINDQSPTKLNHLIRRYINEDRGKEISQKEEAKNHFGEEN